jgi:hypothetical protein
MALRPRPCGHGKSLSTIYDSSFRDVGCFSFSCVSRTWRLNDRCRARWASATGRFGAFAVGTGSAKATNAYSRPLSVNRHVGLDRRQSPFREPKLIQRRSTFREPKVMLSTPRPSDEGKRQLRCRQSANRDPNWDSAQASQTLPSSLRRAMWLAPGAN